jgi:hypothetical protein
MYRELYSCGLKQSDNLEDLDKREEEISIVLRGIRSEGVDWIPLAQDRDQ